MNRRERLQDRYEDALFALLMDDIATIESKKAEEENERLRHDPSAAVPEDLDRRCMQLIHRHFAKQKVCAASRFATKALKRVALAAGMVAILFTTAFITSEAVRIRTLNLMIEIFETNTEFRFASYSEQTPPQLEVGWVPDGYVLTNWGSDSLETWYEYQNVENKTLNISCERTDALVIGIDTEDAEVEHIPIKDSQAMLVEKDSEIQLLWAVQDNSIFVSILGSKINREEIILIANELQYYN